MSGVDPEHGSWWEAECPNSLGDWYEPIAGEHMPGIAAHMLDRLQQTHYATPVEALVPRATTLADCIAHLAGAASSGFLSGGVLSADLYAAGLEITVRFETSTA